MTTRGAMPVAPQTLPDAVARPPLPPPPPTAAHHLPSTLPLRTGLSMTSLSV